MKNKIIEYYSQDYNEENRHNDPFGILQELRTKEIISRYIPNKKQKILDIGGATGIYSFYLAEKGHDVTLLDISPKHIEIVNDKNEKAKNKINKIILGDACIDEIKGEFDIIIVHGPLYHIPELEQRKLLLDKLRNNLTESGLIFGFAINRYAGLFYGINSGTIMKNEYKEMVLSEIKNGVRNKKPGWFFHNSLDLREEFISTGYEIKGIKSVTTQLWMIPEIEKYLSNMNKTDEVLKLCSRLEDELEIGQDLCIICTK